MRVKALVLFVVTLDLSRLLPGPLVLQTLLYSFCAQTSCVDGNQPQGAFDFRLPRVLIFMARAIYGGTNNLWR